MYCYNQLLRRGVLKGDHDYVVNQQDRPYLVGLCKNVYKKYSQTSVLYYYSLCHRLHTSQQAFSPASMFFLAEWALRGILAVSWLFVCRTVLGIKSLLVLIINIRPIFSNIFMILVPSSNTPTLQCRFQALGWNPCSASGALASDRCL